MFNLLRRKGLKYAYNTVHFSIFWGWIRKHPLLIRLINQSAFYPSYIEIETTTRCNLKCVMCEHTYWDEPNKDMSFEEFKSIVDQFPKLKWIGLTGIGESFLNKDFMKMLKYAKSKDVYVELYDTFFFIDRKNAEELINLKVDKIFASIDAATKETYEKIRVGSNFERVINNVKNFFQLEKEKGAYYPKIAFHYIVNKMNFQEMSQYVELAHSLAQGENVSIQFTRMLHEFKELKDLFIEVPEEIIQAIEGKAKEFGIRLTWNADIPQVKPPISRCIEWTMPFIFVTGHVIPCCSGNEAGHRDFQKETALGNVFKQSFKEIWRGEKYKTLRSMLRQGKVPLPCKNCCLYDTKGNKLCES
jgi:MoaA/NifB/PqqE/SkfB family radical SAM enzyme